MQMIDPIFVVKILDIILSSIFLILTSIIFNTRTFGINIIERRALISSRERIFTLFYLILLLPCMLFFSYGEEISSILYYSPSYINRISWAVHFGISDILLFMALWNRSHFRMFTYIPFILMMPCYYYVIIENILTVSNILVNVLFALLLTVNLFITFLPPKIALLDSERIDKFVAIHSYSNSKSYMLMNE